MIHCYTHPIIMSLLPQDLKWTCQKLWTHTQWQGCSSYTSGSRGFQWYLVDKLLPASPRLSRIRTWECLHIHEHRCAIIIIVYHKQNWTNQHNTTSYFMSGVHHTGWICAWIDQQHWCFSYCHAEACCRTTLNGEAYGTLNVILGDDN